MTSNDQRLAFHTLTLSLSFLFLLSTAAAQTQVPPPAGALEANGAGTGWFYQLGSITGSNCAPIPNGICQTSTASASYVPGDGTVSASGSANPGVGPWGAASGADEAIFFEVKGQSGAWVPVLFTASGTTSVSGIAATSTASLTVPYVNSPIRACSTTTGSCGAPPTFSVAMDVNIPSNYVLSFSIGAGGLATADFLNGSSYSASVDPMVEIDPNFAQANQFSLVVSPSPTPEPGSLVMFGSGVLGLAAMVRRRRRN